MAQDFEGVLSRIPGLAGFLAQRQLDEQRAMQGVQQAGGILGLKNAIDAQNESQQVRGILAASPDLASAIQELPKAGATGVTVATHLSALDKAKKDAEFTAKLGDLSTLTPQQLDALGGRLALGSHPGASTVMNIADKRRAQALNDASLSSMRGTVTSEEGPTPPQGGIVPSYLLKSQYVGDSAQALMDRINAGAPGMTAAGVEKDLDRLGTEHNAARNAAALVAARGEQARTTKATAPGVNAAGILSPEAIDAARARYKINGTLPTNLGRGNQGAVNTALILNAHAKDLADEGTTPAAAAAQQLANKSKAVALTGLEKDIAAIEPFKKMLDLNAKIAIDLAKKIESSRTGSQFANRPITWLQNNATDNPDIAEYLFQMQTVKTEGARVLNNPRLVGQLTDSARSEMGNVVNGNMPLGQTERVLKRMMSDGANRVSSMIEQRNAIVGGFGGTTGAPSTGLPAGIPAGSKLIGKSPKGEDIYQSPDGKKWVP